MSVNFRSHIPSTDTKSVLSPFVLSPMASFTAWPLRLLCQQYGAGCTISEMAKAEHIVKKTGPHQNRKILARHPQERLTGMQLVGADPAPLEEAAKIGADRGFDFVDLNAACPVRRIRKSGAGSALLEQPARIAPLLRALAKSGLPVTIKLRAGSRQCPRAAREAATVAEDCGAAAIWLHARVIGPGPDLNQAPDYEFAAEIVAATTAPVFVGGGITTARQAVQVLHQTGAAGILIARGALGNPFIFREANALVLGKKLPGVSLKETVSVIRQHFSGLVSLMGEKTACLHMRRLLGYYVSRLSVHESCIEQVKQITSCQEVRTCIDSIEQSAAACHF